MQFIVVLLFVLFPPPSVLAQNPDAQPLIESAQAPSVDACKAGGDKYLIEMTAKFPGAVGHYACLLIPKGAGALPQPGPADPATPEAPPTAQPQSLPNPDKAVLLPGQNSI